MILRAIIPAFLISVVMLSLTCNNKPTPPPDDGNHYIPSISLTAEDVGVTDAWLRVKFIDTTVNRKFKLVRDGQTVLSALCSSLDTVVLDENLLPNHLYNYKALRLVDSSVVDSAFLSVPTLDTTSHNFIWEIDTLGDGNSSVLRDVAIIDDTCVWAVGEIYKKDSTGQFETEHYGLAKWNGKEWKLQRLKVLTPSGFYSVLGPDGIFAFSATDIWLANGDVHHYNGSTIDKSYWLSDWIGNPNPILAPGQSVEKIWGTSSNNLYAVGRGGAIAHFNGSSWHKIESGTTLPMKDIYGLCEGYIYLIASNNTPSEEIKFMQLKDNLVLNLSTVGLPWSLSTIWFPRPNRIYIGGDGVYYKDLRTDQSWRDIGSTFTHYYTGSIRGTDLNDVYVVTHFGGFYHFNGNSWQGYNLSLPTGMFFKVEVKKDIAVGVGTLGGKYALAVIAKRY